ncbi:MAG TPA: hypothetical protein VMY77_11810 [Chitinophagaceae bacterium]|nr:hypothetical protein [Chitinophagaceae bacterium]
MPSPSTMRLLRDHFRTAPVSEQKEILKSVKASFENSKQLALSRLMRDEFMEVTTPASEEQIKEKIYDEQEEEKYLID